MKRWSWLLLAALAAAPAIADDKKKDDKKAKDAPAVQAPAAQDAVKDAEAKLAAGDADGAIAALEKAMGADPKAALRLGQVRESRGELDLAVDAYKSAADRLTGAAKGEALARMAVVQEQRGMADAAASAEAAVASDPEGVWPTIAMSHRRTHEGKPDEGVALAQKAVAAGGGAGRDHRPGARAGGEGRPGGRRGLLPAGHRGRRHGPRADRGPRHRPAGDRPRRRGGADAARRSSTPRRGRWRPTRRWRG